jgi:hypothetical protein
MLLFQALRNLVHGSKTMSDEEKYLSEAVDHVDLERRMREIDKGRAPFQQRW